MTVHCSKGTYIRTLCNDIGEKLGCFGCMKSLLRTRVANFSLENAYKLEEVEEKNDSIVISVDSLFMDMPELSASSSADKLIANGNRIPVSFITGTLEFSEKSNYRLYTSENKFVGIFEYHEETLDLKPIKIFME